MRLRVVAITQPDWDSYAVIHCEGPSDFGVGKEWFELQRPEVGGYIIEEAWVSPTNPKRTYRRKFVAAESK